MQYSTASTAVATSHELFTRPLFLDARQLIDDQLSNEKEIQNLAFSIRGSKVGAFGEIQKSGGRCEK